MSNMSLSQLFTDIADAIREVDGTTETIQASTFPARISAIPSGGSAASTPLDPQEVYNSTRPADWLSMPTPQDDEMYLLFHIPDGVSSLIAFTATCTGNYTVALGTVTNGEFVQQSVTSVASGVKYEAELFADNYGNLTNDGFKQVMIKVSGANLLTWQSELHSRKTSFYGWNIVEIKYNAPNSTGIKPQHLSSLRFFSQIGTSSATSLASLCSGCSSLQCIPAFDTSGVVNMTAAFQNCYSLISIPYIDTSLVQSMFNTFRNCYSLQSIPEMDTSSVVEMNYAFSGCRSLQYIPTLDLSSATDITSAFQDCVSLKTIPLLDLSSATNATLAFSGCLSLRKVEGFLGSLLTTIYGMFMDCTSLESVPLFNVSNVTDMRAAFQRCYSLQKIPVLDTKKVTNMLNAFRDCTSLIKVGGLDTSAVTNVSGTFSNCNKLQSILIVGGFSSSSALQIYMGSLGHKAIVNLFENLPTVTNKTLDIRGNPGISELTDEEKAIATDKGWTLTL